MWVGNGTLLSTSANLKHQNNNIKKSTLFYIPLSKYIIIVLYNYYYWRQQQQTKKAWYYVKSSYNMYIYTQTAHPMRYDEFIACRSQPTSSEYLCLLCHDFWYFFYQNRKRKQQQGLYFVLGKGVKIRDSIKSSKVIACLPSFSVNSFKPPIVVVVVDSASSHTDLAISTGIVSYQVIHKTKHIWNVIGS